MNEVGISTLLPKTLKYLGISIATHPIQPHSFIQMTVCEVVGEDTLVLCVSEGFGKGDLESAKKLLGQTVKGQLLAPFIKSRISGKKVDKLLPAVKKSLLVKPFLEWNWLF